MYELPFCIGCGKPSSKVGPCEDCGGEVRHDLPGEVVGMGQTVIVRCKGCGDGVPLGGLTLAYRCPACQTTGTIAPTTWAEMLSLSARGLAEQGSIFEFERTRGVPLCNGCGARYPIASMPLDSTSIVTCACGEPLTGSPPPDWLRQVLPCALGIYGGTHGDAPAKTRPAEAVCMACPKCGGNLEVTSATARVCQCAFCQASVFLPAELWSHLHPKTPAERWFLVWSAPIRTAAEIAEGKVARRPEDFS